MRIQGRTRTMVSNNTARVHALAPAAAMAAAQIDDLAAFLCTLTDGFDPNNPSAYNVPAQCQPKESVP